jgi:hypothetical protein
MSRERRERQAARARGELVATTVVREPFTADEMSRAVFPHLHPGPLWMIEWWRHMAYGYHGRKPWWIPGREV